MTYLIIDARSGSGWSVAKQHHGRASWIPDKHPVRRRPGCKNTEGKWEREVPLIGAIRLATRRIKLAGYDPEVRLFTGPRGGGITTATLRDATSWDEVVTEPGNEHLKRHGLRHTGLTWMANATCAAYPARAWAARDVRRSDRRARLSRSTSPADGRNHIHDDANAFRRSCPHGTAIHPVRRGSW